MALLSTPEDLSKIDSPVVLVPTMGALHAGHLALIKRAVELAKDRGQPVVVSVFVNPTQFGPADDFHSYPRDVQKDHEQSRGAGADYVFAPEVETMYPPDQDVPVPTLPRVAIEPGLEDQHRPGHFAGVCRVVARLFDLIRPSIAIFGEKDYQQLLVLRAMISDVVSKSPDRWGDVRVESVPTVRETDGLAMSSRNAYLSLSNRAIAASIYAAMLDVREATSPREAEDAMRTFLVSQGFAVDYAVIRDADTLMPVQTFSAPTRSLVAARLGTTRLIDNLANPAQT